MQQFRQHCRCGCTKLYNLCSPFVYSLYWEHCRLCFAFFFWLVWSIGFNIPVVNWHGGKKLLCTYLLSCNCLLWFWSVNYVQRQIMERMGLFYPTLLLLCSSVSMGLLSAPTLSHIFFLPSRSCFAGVLLAQNHRIVEAGRNLWKSSSPTPC